MVWTRKNKYYCTRLRLQVQGSISIPDLCAEDPVPPAAPGVVLVQTVGFQATPYPRRIPGQRGTFFVSFFWLWNTQKPVHLSGQRVRSEKTAEKSDPILLVDVGMNSGCRIFKSQPETIIPSH